MTRDSIFYYLAPYLKTKVGLITVLIIICLYFFKPHLKKHFERLLGACGSRPFLLTALGLALLVRVLWIAYAPYHTFVSWNSESNESDVINAQALDVSQGKGIVNSDGTPSGRRPVGYIYFLALFYKILGDHPFIPVLLQLLLAMATIIILNLITARFFSHGIAGIVTLFLALYPPFFVSTNIILDEYLFLPLWFGGMLLFLKSLPELKWTNIVWLGVIWGFSTIVRTHSIIMPLVVFATGIFYVRRKWRFLFQCVAMMAVLLAVNLPLAAKNYKTWGAPVYYTATGAYIHGLLNPLVRGDITKIPVKGEPYYSEELSQTTNEGKAHLIGLKLAKKWVRENPLDFLHLCVQKILWFLSPDNFEWAISLHASTQTRNGFQLHPLLSRILVQLEKSIQITLVFSFLTLFAISLFRLTVLLRSPGLMFFLFSILGWIGLHAITNPYVKYRFPLDLLLFPTILGLLHLYMEIDKKNACTASTQTIR